MAVDLDICDAVRSALAEYLKAYLTPLLGTATDTGESLLTVREEWPTAGQKLNQYDITILSTGTPDDWHYYPATKNSVVPTGPLKGTVTYSYGFIDGLQLDMDLFGSAPEHRKDLARLVRNAVNRPPHQTVPGTPAPLFARYDRSPGLILQLTEFFDTLCDYEFSPVAAPVESSDNAQVGEWRAHYRGKASLHVRDQQLNAGLIKRIGLVISTDGHPPDPTRFIP